MFSGLQPLFARLVPLQAAEHPGGLRARGHLKQQSHRPSKEIPSSYPSFVLFLDQKMKGCFTVLDVRASE